jgi:hypothetical protein
MGRSGCKPLHHSGGTGTRSSGGGAQSPKNSAADLHLFCNQPLTGLAAAKDKQKTILRHAFAEKWKSCDWKNPCGRRSFLNVFRAKGRPKKFFLRHSLGFLNNFSFNVLDFFGYVIFLYLFKLSMIQVSGWTQQHLHKQP